MAGKHSMSTSDHLVSRDDLVSYHQLCVGRSKLGMLYQLSDSVLCKQLHVLHRVPSLFANSLHPSHNAISSAYSSSRTYELSTTCTPFIQTLRGGRITPRQAPHRWPASILNSRNLKYVSIRPAPRTAWKYQDLSTLHSRHITAK